MSNRRYTQFFYTPHGRPTLLDCNFIVDAANGNGCGVRSVKGSGISAVYMHTSATPAAGNPNPGAGTIIVKFQDNFPSYHGGFAGVVSPVGSSSTSTAANVASVITVLGTASTAQWVAVGLPIGIKPAVGVAFVPTATAVIGGGAYAAPIGTNGSGIDHIEIIGNPALTLSSTSATKLSGTSGAYLMAQCFLSNVQTAPTDGTVIGMSFYLNNTSVGV